MKLRVLLLFRFLSTTSKDYFVLGRRTQHFKKLENEQNLMCTNTDAKNVKINGNRIYKFRGTFVVFTIRGVDSRGGGGVNGIYPSSPIAKSAPVFGTIGSNKLRSDKRYEDRE